MKNYISISMMLFSFVLATAQISKPEAGQTTYIIDGGSEELTSEGDITLLPGSWIKTGSTFRASIILDTTTAEDPYTSFTMSDENYILTRVYHTAFDDFDPAFAKEGDAQEQLTYLDGLGRPIQQLALKATPDKNDIITHIAYDAFGRTPKQYLPYEAISGTISSLRSNVIPDLNTHYRSNYGQDIIAGSENPFSETEYEASPLNRMLRQAAPGYDWRMDGGHEISLAYDTNVAQEVRYFDAKTDIVEGINKPILDQVGYYQAGELYKTITYDENHTTGKDHSTEEFIDKQGRVVLKRTYDNEVAHDTYYIYDTFGNLSFVMPPKVSTATISSDELTELMYQYIYDHRDRLIEKKIPGKGWEYIVYNKLDQPYMTQDPNLKAKDQWLFTTYDPFGRVAYTGIDFNTSDRKAVQEAVDGMSDQYVIPQTTATTHAGTSFYYSKLSYPVNFTAVYTINYYDDYNTTRDGIAVPTGIVLEQAITTQTQGLPTVSKVRVLETNDWITTLTAYDVKGRPIYIQTENEYLDTEDIIESELDFSGKIIESRATHSKGNQPAIVTIDTFTYNHESRPITIEQELNGHNELITHNIYDNLGLLIKKKVGNTLEAPLQEVDYEYNVRGWLQGINDQNGTDNILTIDSSDLFGFKIDYNNPETGTALYNGNISSTQWRSQNEDKNLRAYSYTYDALNRIVGALDSTGDSRYSLAGISYDKNGNILSLSRNGHTNENATSFGVMDNLVYTYDTGNKLTKVLDNGHDDYGFTDGVNQTIEYTYDDNGNMLTDANKGITAITYNHLNLPTQVAITNAEGSGTINYVYDAIGTKQRKIVEDGATHTTDYAGNYVYENNILQFFNTPEGYVEPDTNNNYNYVYQYKDHLGNIRLSYADDNNDEVITATEIREENNYYPFGLQHKGYNNVSTSTNIALKYKQYQGQEFTEDLGLNTHEWKYRMSDPSIGRFWQIDPLAEDYVYNGTYNFSENRVIDSAELEGLERIYAGDGKFIGQVGDNTDPRVLHNTDGSSSAQTLISTANNTDASPEDRQNAVDALNAGSFKGYSSPDKAAIAFLSEHNAQSIKDDVEIGTKIYDVELEDGSTVSIMTPAVRGSTKVDRSGVTERGVNMRDMVGPKVKIGNRTVQTEMPGTLSGTAHTHARGSHKFSPENTLRGGDKGISRNKNIPVYITSPERGIRVYDYHSGRTASEYDKKFRRRGDYRRDNGVIIGRVPK